MLTQKHGGRDPLIRQFNWLRHKGYIEPVITFFLLLFLIGINTTLHNEYFKGGIFLIIVFTALITGGKKAENFFGSSAIALFIALHVSFYGFSFLALLICFLLYLCLRNIFERDLKYPITVYLLVDSLFIYANLDEKLHSFFDLFGHMIFSRDIIAFSFLPLAFAIFYLLEVWFAETAKSAFWKCYGAFVIIWSSAIFFFVLRIGLKIQIAGTLGVISLLIYLMGVITYQKEYPKILFLSFPAFLTVGALLIIKIYFSYLLM